VSLLLDISYLVAAIVTSPWLIYRLFARGDARELTSRFGLRLGERISGSIWLHGSSAGEIALLVPLVSLIERSRKDCRIVVSAYSSTGLAAARRAFPDHKVVVFPFDFSFVVRHVFNRLQPRLIVIVESEFWPNFLRHAHSRGIPVVVVNGKMSLQSHRRYTRLPLLAAHLRRLNLLAVQSEDHGLRFRSLKVPADRIHTTGNMKYDSAVEPSDSDTRTALRQRYGFTDDDTIIIGGSLHDREDAALIAAFAELIKAHPNARLILVPRYPADSGRAEAHLQAAGFRAARKSALDASRDSVPTADEVLVVDTVGELRTLYGLADIAFVGGSLFFRGGNKGGHNLMEPAVFGIPVLFGPHNVSFADTARALKNEGGGFEVTDQASLRAVLGNLIGDNSLRRRSGQLAKQVIDARRGATRSNFELLLPLLDVPSS
jgi:3-deoxy-D-manno-octulosonic-acid transferase